MAGRACDWRGRVIDKHKRDNTERSEKNGQTSFRYSRCLETARALEHPRNQQLVLAIRIPMLQCTAHKANAASHFGRAINGHKKQGQQMTDDCGSAKRQAAAGKSQKHCNNCRNGNRQQDEDESWDILVTQASERLQGLTSLRR